MSQPTKTHYQRIREERCEGCAKGIEIDEKYAIPTWLVHLCASGSEPPCTAPTTEQLIEEMAEQNAILHDQLVDTQILAFRWMKAHDARAAGKPVVFPSTADKPELERKLEIARKALEEMLAATRSMGWVPQLDGWDGPTQKAESALAALEGKGNPNA